MSKAVLALLLPVLAVLSAQAEGKAVSIGIIGMGGGAFETLKTYEHELNVRMTHLTSEAFRQKALPDLSEFDMIITSFASDDLKAQYKQSLSDARKKNPDQKVFCVGPPAIHAMWTDWVGEDIVRFDPKMARYYGLSKKSMRDLIVLPMDYVISDYAKVIALVCF